MELINPWLLYLVMQADSIGKFFGILAATSVIASVISGVALLVGACEGEGAWVKAASRLLIKLVLLAVVLCGIRALLPSTKTAAVLIVVPALVNNPALQHEAGELYSLAKQAMQENLQSKKTPTPDEEK